MGINLQTSQRASQDSIGALDKEDGGNCGEASCEKRATDSAGRSRVGSDGGARSGRLGDAAKELAWTLQGPRRVSYNPVEASVPAG